MAVRKKNKAGSFFITLIVIALISIAMMVVLMDQAYQERYDKMEEGVVDSYLNLDESLKELDKNLDGFINGVDKMNGVDIEGSDFEGASEILDAKFDELDLFMEEFYDSYKNEQKGLNYHHYFNYTINDLSFDDYIDQLREQTELELLRAPSADVMDNAVEKFKKNVKAIETNVQRLYKLIETIEKNGIEFSDYETYVSAKTMFDGIKFEVFELDTSNNVYEHATLSKKFAEMFEAFKPLCIDAFIETVNSLPKNVNKIHLDDEKTVLSARELYDSLTNFGFYTAEELKSLDNKDFHKAESAFLVAEKHMNVLNQMYGSKDKDGNTIPGNNALWINEQITSYKKTEIKGDPQTKIWLEELLAYAKAWIKNTWVCNGYGYTLVTNSKDKNYCEEIYNMLDHETLNSYVEKYEDEVADLRYEADHIIMMVGKNPDFDYETTMEDYIKPVQSLFDEDLKAVSGDLEYEEIDFVLGYDTATGLNAASIAFSNYKKNFDKYVELVDNTIEDGNDAIKALKDLIKYNCDKDHGKNKCDCVLPVYDSVKVEAAIKQIDAIILEILGQYGLDESYFDEDLLAYYKEARLLLVKKAALENAEFAHSLSTAEYKDDGYNALLNAIEIISSVSYTLEAELDGTNYVLVEKVLGEDKAPTAALSEYDLAKCVNIINSYDPEK